MSSGTDVARATPSTAGSARRRVSNRPVNDRMLVLFGGEDVSLLVPIIAAAIGAAVGAVSGLLAYAATGGKRDFTSNTGIVATSYELLCQPAVAEDARNLLGRLALRDG